jgi:phage gp36-like protein
MPYCTRSNLEDRFGADVMEELAAGNDSTVDEAIMDADSLIDSYIGARYALPLVSIPPVLVSTARNIVRYNLDIDPGESISKRHSEALKFLEALAHGRATLGIPQASEPTSLDTAEFQSDGHVFRRSDSKGFI